MKNKTMFCFNGWGLTVVGILFVIPLILAADYNYYDEYDNCGDCCDYETDHCKITPRPAQYHT